MTAPVREKSPKTNWTSSTLVPKTIQSQSRDIDLLVDILEKIHGKDTQLTTEIAEHVLSKSDAEVEHVGTQRIVTEVESPNMVAAPKAVARVVPTNQVMKKKQPANAVAGLLLKVLKVVQESGLADLTEELTYDTYKPHPEFPNVPLSNMMKMVQGVPPGEYFFSGKKFARLVFRVLRLVVGLQLTSDDVANAKTYEEKFRAMFTNKNLFFVFPNPFNLVPKPIHVLNAWESDKEFARQFMNGVNPIMISVVKNVNAQLTDELVEFFKHHATVNLEALAKDKRLFYVSYDDLVDLKVNPHQAFPKANNPDKPQDEPRYFNAPVVVFQLSQDRQELDILGIQLERVKGANVYTASTTDKNMWLFAKSCVATADSNMHEWVSHLGHTHFTLEPIIIAIHNTLKRKNHKVYTFVKPMTRSTLFLNWAARFTLADFGPASFGDRQTSVGVGQCMQLIKKYWDRYDFFESSGLVKELQSRGFDDSLEMPCYLYREDGLLIWNAYGRFARNFVDEVYKDDAQVAADTVLQEWADETTKKAQVPGFPTKFPDKDTLVRTLQTIGWNAGPEHAAINMPQYDYYGFAPNKPLGFRASMDMLTVGNNKDDKDWIFEHAYPYLDIARESLQVVRALTIPSRYCLDNLEGDYKETPAEDAYRLFQVDLEQIGKLINDRNTKAAKQGKAVYPYLHPSVVPASIDI